MRAIASLVLLSLCAAAQPAILGTINIAGGSASVELPTSALVTGVSPSAIGRLLNSTGFTATDITLRIEPAPGFQGTAPRFHNLSVGGVAFTQTPPVGEVRVNIAALAHMATHDLTINTCGVATASMVRISCVLSASPPWCPEVDILRPVVLGPEVPVAALSLPFQGDSGVLFWLESATADPLGSVAGADLRFTFGNSANSVLEAVVLDEFSLLPLPQIQATIRGNTVTLIGAPLLAPLERHAVVVTFKQRPTAGVDLLASVR